MCLEEELIDSLPWKAITPFCTLDQVLNARLVRRSLCEVIGNGLSPQECADYLSHFLVQRNIFFIPHLQHWKESATQEVDAQMFGTANDLHLDKLLRVFRVMKHLPESMAVAFSGKHGRHCLPLKWDEEEKRAKIHTYAPCRRGKSNCASCRLKLKVRESESSFRPTNNVYDGIEAYDKQQRQIDLHEYSSKCIPNLPNDLICPQCKVGDRRTLVLSEFSYKSDVHSRRPDCVLLSFTPSFRSSEKEEQPAPKRQKTAERAANPGASLFPPRYDDMAIPTRLYPLELKPDCKFAMSIHCTNCQEFGIFAPAAVCWNQDFCCAFRRTQPLDATMVGGTMTRKKCSVNDCNRPTCCPQCAHDSSHHAYEDDRAQVVLRTYHCCSCNQTYCDADAWLSTTCHHS
eukprot:scaffold25036_cov166-Cylindrotheca_fusiformis.AAC.3